MTISDIYKQIQSGQIPKLLYLYGVEGYIFDDIVRVCTDKLQLLDINKVIIRTDTSVDDLINLIITAPFMQNQKLIILQKIDLVGNIADDDLQRLTSILEKLPEFTKLIIYDETVDRKRKLYKFFSTNFDTCELGVLEPATFESWVKKHLKLRGLELGGREFKAFVDYSGYNDKLGKTLYDISSAISYFSSLDKQITTDDIVEFFGEKNDVNIFKLIDVLGKPESQRYMLSVLLENDPFMLLGFLSTEFRKMLKVKMLLSSGATEKLIAEVLKIKEFAVKYIVQRAKKFSTDQLRNVLARIDEMDKLMKSSDISAELLFIKFVNYFMH